MKDYNELAVELLARAKEFEPPNENRRQALSTLANYMSEKLKADAAIRLNFICTHNSRRSHIGQVIAQVLGAHLGLEKMETYSGGTEATAFNRNAVNALRNLGVNIVESSGGDNPRYEVHTGKTKTIAFSKQFSEAPNPSSGFAAIMVCSSADANCPFVAGAEKRISLPFDDPKESDGTGHEERVYRERALEMGTQLAWAFSRLKQSYMS